MTRVLSLIVASSFTLWTTIASAAFPRLVIVERNSDGMTIATTYDESPSSVGSIDLLDATSRVNIFVEYSEPPESAIEVGHIVFNQDAMNGQGVVSIIVGKGAYIGDDTQLSAGDALICSAWRGLEVPESATTFRIYGRLTGDLIGSGATGFANGTFKNLDRLSRLDIDGDLNAFFAVGAPASSTFVVWAANFSQLGRIQLDSGEITQIRVFGDIDRPSASNVASVAAGTSGVGNIALIQVDGSLRGDVVCRGYNNDTQGGRIGQIIVGGHIAGR